MDVVEAMVWLGGPAFERRAVARPDPGPGEVLVSVDLATVCGSDRHTVAGHRAAPVPSILGHEAVGHAVAVGAGATTVTGTPVAVGDRVVWGVTVSCGACRRCGHGLTAKCAHVRKVGHEPFDGPWPLSGSYATHVLLPAGASVVVAPEPLPDAAAAVAACAAATVVAAREAAEPWRGRRVLVVGAGMLGLIAVAACARDAAAVFAHDPDDARVAQAIGLGATVDDGAPVDVVLELSGARAGVFTALDRLDVGGVAVLAGTVSPVGSIELDPEQLVRRRWRLVGVHNYEPRHLAEAVELLAGAPLDWDRLIAPPVPLGGLPELMTAPLAPGQLRASIAPQRPA